VHLAARGTRDDDSCTTPVTDAGERDALRRQARGVHVRAMALAVGGAAVAIGLRVLLGSGG